jgi:hypothetical protein
VGHPEIPLDEELLITGQSTACSGSGPANATMLARSSQTVIMVNSVRPVGSCPVRHQHGAVAGDADVAG